MASDIGFSGPGAPDISNPTSGGQHPETPVFFSREGDADIEREVSPQDYATAKERAMRLDAIAGTGDGRAEQSAPVV